MAVGKAGNGGRRKAKTRRRRSKLGLTDPPPGKVTVRRVDPELMKDGWPTVGEGEVVRVVGRRKIGTRRDRRANLKERPLSAAEKNHWDALRSEHEAARASRKQGFATTKGPA